MQNWKLLIEYDGTRYSGWQKQPHARTVQGELLKTAENVFGAKLEIGGAGRTDSGVHALGQVAHLKVNSRDKYAPQKIQKSLNDSLPADINILRVQSAMLNFHARHDAVARYYLYQIATRRTAFGKPFVWWIKDRLDAEAMARAAEMIVGRHDFRSFSERDGIAQNSTVVEVEQAEFVTAENLLLFRIGASHYLWKMVRRLVGTFVEIGRGNVTLKDFEKLLVNYSNQPAALTAPPSGLFLEQILYPGDVARINTEPAFPIH
jgi:tRNA pseudouridine38-40 synthase